jgi:hypothetical protein
MSAADGRISARRALESIRVELLEAAIVLGAVYKRGSATQTELARFRLSLSRIAEAERLSRYEASE